MIAEEQKQSWIKKKQSRDSSTLPFFIFKLLIFMTLIF
jgi:hypothetical protein